jgi:hypothetical protein
VLSIADRRHCVHSVTIPDHPAIRKRHSQRICIGPRGAKEQHLPWRK